MPEPISLSVADRTTSSLLAGVAGFIQREKLIGVNDRVLCMVSGGPDSTAMVRLLHAISTSHDHARSSGFSMGICHVNYGRRGDDSNGDEEFVRRLGDQLRLTVHTISAPMAERSNFQAWARDFRYLAAENICRWQGYTRIAVGHNRDDRIETFLYRLVTYSGRRSLVVMPPRTGKVIRPLLFLTANEIRDYCGKTGIETRDDSSNRSLEYRRNRIRRQLIPCLEEIKPDFRDRIEDTISLLEDEEAVLERVTRDAWEEAAGGDRKNELSAAAVALLDRGAARLVIRRWLSKQAVDVRISRRLVDAILELCGSSSGCSSLSVSGGLTVERQYDRLMLSETGARQDSALAEVGLPIPGRVEFGEYMIEAKIVRERDVAAADSLRVEIDGSGIDTPLAVRPWSPGDKFKPLGMGGTKSLQDLFTDEKIPRMERGRMPVVTAGDEIVWVCGLRISEDFKISGRSERVIELKATRRQLEQG